MGGGSGGYGMGSGGLGGGSQASGVNFQVPSCSPHWLMAIYHLPFSISILFSSQNINE